MPRAAKRARDEEGATAADGSSSADGAAEQQDNSVASNRPKRAAKAPASATRPATEHSSEKDAENSRGATLPLTTESRLWKEKPYALIAGVDEAGRGPLCGPVVASCCIIMPPPLWPALLAGKQGKTGAGANAGAEHATDLPEASALVTGPWKAPVQGVADSKTVEEEERERIFPLLVSDPRLVFGTAVVDHATIDRVNILRATMLAMDCAAARAAEEARVVIAGLAGQVGMGLKLAAAGGKLDVQSEAWTLPFGGQARPGETAAAAGAGAGATEGAGAMPVDDAAGSNAGPAGLDPFLRLHTVLIDGNKCPPGLIMACAGPPEEPEPQAGGEGEAEAEGVGSKGNGAEVQEQEGSKCTSAARGRGSSRGRGRGRGGSSSASKPPKPSPPVENEAYAVTVQGLARAAMEAHIGANIVTEDGGAAPSGSSAAVGPAARTVADVFSIPGNCIDAGAHAAHESFHTSAELAGRVRRVFTVQPVIGGDGKVYAIAAASLVAKVTRDRLMRSAGATWPAYGLEAHKGYGTASHMAAIGKHGPCPIHRLTFAPLKDMYPRSAAKAKGVPAPAGAGAAGAGEEDE